MFLSPSGTPGMKYRACWAPPVQEVRLQGSRTLVEVPMEKLGATTRWPKHESRACILPATTFPSKETGTGEAPTRTSGWGIPLSAGSAPVPGLAELPAAPCPPAAPQGSGDPWSSWGPKPFLAFSPSSGLQSKCLATGFAAVAALRGLLHPLFHFRICFCFTSVMSKIAAPSTE